MICFIFQSYITFVDKTLTFKNKYVRNGYRHFLGKVQVFYKNLLENQFFPAIKKQNAVDEYWFMQDGATPHRTKDVFETLFNCFNTPVIGLNYPKFAKGGLEWPPYSPDLNPLDFFFWGYLKDKVYKNNPKTLSELKNAIIVEINNIEV